MKGVDDTKDAIYITFSIIIIIMKIMINGIFTQDNPSVQSTVVNGVLLTKNLKTNR